MYNGSPLGERNKIQDSNGVMLFTRYLTQSSYSKKLYPQYTIYYMDRDLYWKQIRNGTIATARPNCNGKTISKMCLPLSLVLRQKRIVEKLDTLMVQLA